MQFLLHEHFQRQALISPQSIALHDGNRSISCAELNERSDRVANALMAQGVQQGSYVGLHLERSIEWVTAVIAILKCDAAVVPLPPSYPQGRLKEILTFATLDIVIDDENTPLDRALAERIIRLDELISSNCQHVKSTSAHHDQPAFVLCSSGSTGRPKMIARSHRSFFDRLQWTWDNHPYTEDDVCCQKAHMTTTHAIYELFEPLLRGQQIVIISDAETRQLESFWDTIRHRGISRLLIVPSALRASLETPQFEAPALDVLVLMGEYVHPKLAMRAVDAFPESTALYSIYGSTEASSALVCDLRESSHPDEELPLGKPISSDVQALVLNPDLQPVLPGSTGRLYISGTTLFNEYYKDPDLTSTVLIDIPDHASLVYDTRDDVQHSADGRLHFLGRTDHTVKVRGFRVDLPEVERAILSHPGIDHAVVLLDGADTGNATLLAFYTPAREDRTKIYETLRQLLPDYMIPSVLVGLDEFPLTNSAKVDRVGLLSEYVNGVLSATDSRDLSDTERRVEKAWKHVLGHRRFGPDSPFFDVGGTSLTVFSLVHLLREEFQLDRSKLSEQSVYQFSTVEELASYIEDVQSGRQQRDERTTPILVTLRKETCADQPPLFVVAAAGGTLGAYEKLARTLTTTREIVGVRDPFIWGGRDPRESFQRWVARYIEAIRERQPDGPYYLCAYSSAGAFGYEIAHQLRENAQEVAILALVDPLAIGRHEKWQLGYWLKVAKDSRLLFPALARIAAWLGVPIFKMLQSIHGGKVANDFKISDKDFAQVTNDARHKKSRVLTLSAQLELNTGLPLALCKSDLEGVSDGEYLAVLQSRMEELLPEVDRSDIERTAIQYDVQARTQHAYQLQRYDGQVLVVEPASPYAGLVAAQFRPQVRNLRARVLKIDAPPDPDSTVIMNLGTLVAHYRCMRDDVFVNGLARELEELLD